MLTQNEYKLVSLLGLHAGKVLTYDYLIRELWGPSAKSDNQILRVNMANIRRKIERNPAQPVYIFTEVGVGYRMIEGSKGTRASPPQAAQVAVKYSLGPRVEFLRASRQALQRCGSFWKPLSA